MFDLALDRLAFVRDKGPHLDIFLVRNVRDKRGRDGQGGPTLLRYTHIFELCRLHRITAYLGLKDSDAVVSPCLAIVTHLCYALTPHIRC